MQRDIRRPIVKVVDAVSRAMILQFAVLYADEVRNHALIIRGRWTAGREADAAQRGGRPVVDKDNVVAQEYKRS